MLIGDHYVGENIHFSLQDREYWKKTLGPIFIYSNSNSNSNQNQSSSARDVLWQDAKAQVAGSVISICNKIGKIAKMPLHFTLITSLLNRCKRRLRAGLIISPLLRIT